MLHRRKYNFVASYIFKGGDIAANTISWRYFLPPIETYRYRTPV
nr:MAG TPA: hypothetical protein [Caudoviricetes sp.]